MKKWADDSQRLKEILCLEGSPVGVALRERPLENIDTPPKGFTFCQFVIQARVKKKVLQGNAQNILCCKGRVPWGSMKPRPMS